MDVANQRSATDMTIPDSTCSRETSATTEQVRRWSHRWAALAGCDTPADVMAACRISDSFSDAALSALLRIVNGRYEGSPLAAEILLQTLIPSAMRQHARPILHASPDPGGAVGMLIAGIVEAIATYPLRRRLGVKEHLLDLVGMAFREKACTTTPAERAGRSDVPYDRAALRRAGDTDEEVAADPLVQAAETLAAALRREAVGLAEARLVTRQHAFAQ